MNNDNVVNTNLLLVHQHGKIPFTLVLLARK